MRRIIMFLLCATFVFSAAASAQDVDELIAKNLAAKGGLAKIRAIQSVRISGSFEAGGMLATFAQLQKRPDKMRRDIVIQGMTLVQAYDGQNGWQIIPFTGNKDPQPVTGDELKSFAQEADIGGDLVDYKQKGTKIEFVGKERIGAIDAYNLKITLKDGDVRNIYLSGDTFLEVLATGKTKRQGVEVEFETTLSNYREVGGIMYPFTIESQQHGGQGFSQKILIQQIEVNVSPEDSFFKMPPPAIAPAIKTEPAPAGQEPKKP